MDMEGLSDRDLLALTIWAEARNQPVSGQLGVGYVILNRLASGRWGHSIRSVVLAPHQFSCWTPSDDLNHRALLSRAKLVRGSGRLEPRLRTAYWIADGVLSGSAPNPIGRARHYLNPAVLPRLPGWADPEKRSAIIADHHFYEDVA